MANSKQVAPATRRFSSDATKTFVAETLGTSNKDTRQKFDNIMALTGPEELNDDYVMCIRPVRSLAR